MGHASISLLTFDGVCSFGVSGIRDSVSLWVEGGVRRYMPVELTPYIP